MAGNDEHLRLSGVVKGVHSTLRQRFHQTGDYESVWAEHCQDTAVLTEYADAMHKLAEEHWTHNPETRIDWCRTTCINYFHEGGLQKILEKEQRQHEHEERQSFGEQCTSTSENNGIVGQNAGGKEESVSNDEYDDGELADLIMRRQSEFAVMTCTSDGIRSTDDGLSCHAVPSESSNQPTPCGSSRHRADSQLGTGGIDNSEMCGQECKDHKKEMLDRCMAYVAKQQGFLQDHDRVESSSALSSLDCTNSEDAVVDLCDGIDNDVVESGERTGDSHGFRIKNYNMVELPLSCRMRLLDVGSCFNPFLRFDEFYSIGIDISPAVDTVYRCDFLHLDLGESIQVAPDTMETMLHNLPPTITRLPKQSFHVIVFSLLLEYFPAPYQRWICVQKAHDLLMTNGLLIVITPDSAPQHKNQGMIQSWRTAIEGLGFQRCRYEKQTHLHCLAFRRISSPSSLNLISDVNPDMLYIPQDFTVSSPGTASDEAMRSEEENSSLRHNFMELPDLTLDS